MRALFVLKCGLAAVLLAGSFCRAVAGPLEELKAASGVEGVEAKPLLRGDILTARGTRGSFARGIYAESCYFLKAAPETVKTTLLHGDPSKYKETEVSAYRSYRWPAGPEVFKAMHLTSAQAADRTLLDWTISAVRDNAPGELHLTREEIAGFRQAFAEQHAVAKAGERDPAVDAAWQGLLQRHSDAVGTGGLAALPSYKAGSVNIVAAKEFRSLLKMTPGIAARFAGLTGTRPLAAGGVGAVDEIAPYTEESLVRGHTSFCLGAAAAARAPEGGWQVLDLTYYTADTYFLSFSLYQLWPWEGGTLVWEVDYASAPFRGYLGGLDRVFAGKEMTKDSAGSVATLRKELAARGR